ncbi:hypothetical protein ABZX85_35440 [Streptomyces sp. NPDC004539]|uniref:hypothetical protein n=1 Tax=Streptomyces sp. NPDC004539 TaxID=3154280 RepID=UPI0033BC07D3
MERSEDRILAEALAALGPGGGRLVRWVASLMPKNVREIDLVVPLPFEEAVARVAEVLYGAGRRVDDGGGSVVRVVVGGGAGGLNPVVVTVSVSPGGEDGAGTAVRVRAAAKEGLVKQRAGEKTAVWVAESLRG